MGMTATALAVALTVALFRTIGPKRTRLVAQILAAVVGAAFVIGLQAAAIMSDGTLSRVAFLQSADVVARAPALDSWLWLPARAMLGDGAALAAVLAASVLLLGVVIRGFAPRFADHALAAASVAQDVTQRSGGRMRFRLMSPTRALRRKEWMLLRRDPWLLSQTLMQLLYLLPPALLLWRNFAGGSHALALLVPVLIMAAGQLAGGLAWLAISGEDAPDLVASAPVQAGQVLRAKIEAVMGGIAMVFAPFLLALSLASVLDALVAAVGIAVAATASTAIQLWFRSQAKRSHFRRRQTSSRVATFAEALSSTGWAATGALAAAGTWFAVITGLLTLGIVAGARMISPARS
jgi:ABC-2 type transport system permease protein